DCRKYKWPDQVDMIATDPPWNDLDAYRWLAGFARDKLPAGGLALVMVGNQAIAHVIPFFKGLTYVWTLALVYGEVSPAPGVKSIATSHQPLMLWSKGPQKWLYQVVTDVYSVTGFHKKHHVWEQPVKPFRYWLERLARPGWTVADPFAGSGTITVACKQI